MSQDDKPTTYDRSYQTLINQIGDCLSRGRVQSMQQVNTILIETYWQIGRYIVEFEQRGQDRAEYGSKLLNQLSKDLKAHHGKGFGRSNLQYMRLLYLIYPNCQTLSGKLSWSHYIELLAVSDELARSFYEQQCIQENWSVRELKRQKDSALFERIALSKDRAEILALAKHGQRLVTAHDIIKDPYVFEFLELPDASPSGGNRNYKETELEQRLIEKLEQFLLELGKGFAFIGQQYRITLNNTHFYVDLVFYHRILKCFVLIDLKIRAVNHQDIGQMNLYLNYFRRGFESAARMVQSPILPELSQTREGCRHIYGGLITTLMRLVFLLYAEERDMMPDDEVYNRHYSVLGLYDRLLEENGTYPDTMDQRYGAWAGLLSLFRLVYEGGGPYQDYLPARHGQLFDPDAYPFLEGTSPPSPLSTSGEGGRGGEVHLPQVSDGVVLRMLDKLLMLNGDRLAYRALGVEEIGSVYEGIMGFEVEVAKGASIALRPTDVVVNLEALLAQNPADRAKMLSELECKVEGKIATDVKAAKTIVDLQAALDRRISHRTPGVLPVGSLYLQPGEERRRSGSHYTPQKLTAPIVETTLRPILEQLGEQPTAAQILDLKVCDLAMGSGAFLVQTCRQLADEVVKAWDRDHPLAPSPSHSQGGQEPHPLAPSPLDGEGGQDPFSSSSPLSTGGEGGRGGEVDRLLYARRLVAQRCLYGVDKNPFAVNLAKLSLWLLTLANDRPFTFLDHALKCGDSLVGLTSKEIGSFTKTPQLTFLDKETKIREELKQTEADRRSIQEADTTDDRQMEQKYQAWQRVEQRLAEPRLAGQMKVAAFFKGKKTKERESLEKEYQILFNQGTPEEKEAIVSNLTQGDRPVEPFHWEIEFPEVFDRPNPGFDAIVGNPPFAGKNTTINAHPEGYVDWLKEVNPEAHGNSDLVAHFFRRAFVITRVGGTFGLIATNTIAQGDTRSTGLRFICNNGGVIYNATRRYRWPGMAAVVVSVVHIWKETHRGKA